MSIANEWNIKIGFSFILAMLAQNISIAIYLRLSHFKKNTFCFDFAAFFKWKYP